MQAHALLPPGPALFTAARRTAVFVDLWYGYTLKVAGCLGGGRPSEAAGCCSADEISCIRLSRIDSLKDTAKNGAVFAAKAVETQAKGSVAPLVRVHQLLLRLPMRVLLRRLDRPQGKAPSQSDEQQWNSRKRHCLISYQVVVVAPDAQQLPLQLHRDHPLRLSPHLLRRHLRGPLLQRGDVLPHRVRLGLPGLPLHAVPPVRRSQLVLHGKGRCHSHEGSGSARQRALS